MEPINLSRLVRRMPWPESQEARNSGLVEREWLVSNGLGGYASGTIAGACTRRYHGLLIAALSAPLGRQMMLNYLSERIRLPDDKVIQIGAAEHDKSALELHGVEHLQEFRLEAGLPVWRYQVDDHIFEKRVLLPHQQNTVHIGYRLVAGAGPIRLKLRPALHFRGHDDLPSPRDGGAYTVKTIGDRYEISRGPGAPTLRLQLHGQAAAFTLESADLPSFFYRVEKSRGYPAVADLWSPGYFRVDLTAEQSATLVASTESWEIIQALLPEEVLDAERERRRRLLAIAHPAARAGFGAELVLAADQFVIRPEGRVEDAARAHAAGDVARTVIAGYHWFTDWGRDTMIGLPGLTLATGRSHEAASMLRTFAHRLRDGLLPNLFPEGSKEGLYHTADATLWFFQAVARYVNTTGDRDLLRFMLPRLKDVVAHHVHGTDFGIGVDADDGLLKQGAAGYQLTWMDAKVGDWVVTPRRGKAVEINALWYNALCLLENWLREEGEESTAQSLGAQARKARQSFNRRFWYEKGGYLFDVVDGESGDDPACRPNQIFAMSLPHAILDRERWQPVLEVVRARLLTPVGLRSLAPDDANYKSKYFGDLRSRDAAYHQGTVWAWLIGPFIDAWLKIHSKDFAGARKFLAAFENHLDEACLGSISEIFDAEAPFTPRGCIAQAWSVAEVLRCWVEITEQSQV
ncbi:MAG TPA: amylo-alpha-1,6-glucosidase [Gemmataceae bacterium]|nr:amylo-alpha-1,6-glucosidase [Gemmataceae bacterium]